MKNLINYLSKKSLSLENGSRMVRDRFEIGSAKSRKSIGSNLSRLCLVSLICLCMLTDGVGNAWGDTWTRVTSISELTSGGTFIMGYEATAKSGVIIPLRSYDCNATTSANGYFYTGTTNGSSTNGTIDMANPGTTTNYEVYISSPTSGKINIQRANSSGNYYGASSGGTSKNTGRLYTSGNSNETNLTPEWASETNNQFKLKASVSGSYKYLKYNTGAPRFAYYNTAGEKIVFYKKSTGGTTYTVSYAAGTGGSGTNPGAHTGVSSGSSITLKANTFTAPTGKQFAGWNDGSTTRAAGASYTVTGNVTMTAQWECITPTISGQPSNGSCVQNGSPSALTVTASGGTLSYQWKESTTSGGTYTNVSGGSGGTTASYTPPVTTVGTKYYKCVVTNTGSSCNTTATSNAASFEVTEPAAAASITLENYSGSNPTGLHVGDTYTLPSSNSSTCGTKTFVGWSSVEIANSASKPNSNYYEPGASVSISSASMTFYAVFATSSGGGDANSITTLASGTYYLVDTQSDKYYATSGTGTNVTGVDITSAVTENLDGTISIDASNNVITAAMQYTVTVGQSTTTVQNVSNSNYIGGSGNTSFSTTSTNQWTVTKHTTEGRFTFVYSGRCILYRDGYNFRNYGTGNRDGSGYGHGYLYLVPTSGGSPTYSNYTTSCASCSYKVTLSKGAETNGTYTLSSANGSYDNCDANFVVTVSSITPAAGYVVDEVTATGGNSSVSGPDGSGNYTVTYTKGNNITSTITVSFKQACATPTFLPAAGTYDNDVTVTISCASPSGTTIHYTTNDTDPTCSTGSTGTSATISSNNTTLKAIACKAGCDPSSVASATYLLKCATPTFSPAAGTYSSAQSVTLACTTDGATIKYTTDGRDPATYGATYSSAISVSADMTIKAIATKTNYQNSDEASATYRIMDCDWYESFDNANGSGGNDDIWSGSIGTSSFTPDKTDWTFSSTNCGAKNCIKLGTTGAGGSAQTAALTDMRGTLSLKFRAAGFGTDGSSDGNGHYTHDLTISATNGTVTPSSVTITNQTWDDYEVSISNVTANTQLTIASSGGYRRFFLDEVCIKEMPSFYTVTFNANGHGTAPDPITDVAKNSTINSSKPSDPTATGWTFGGWYKEEGCTNAWNWATDQVTKNTTLYAKWTCSAPTSLSISSTDSKYDFCAGESMTLTVSGSDIASDATYQWNLGGSPISGATSASYTTTMAAAKAGEYTCTVSNGTCSATTSGFWVRVWQLYINNGAAGAWQELNFTNTGSNTGSNTAVELSADGSYQFKLKDNNGGWFGLNSKTITGTESNITLNGTGANVNLTAGLGGNYTFTINYSDKNSPKVSVTYPTANQPANNVVYFDKSVITGWTTAGTTDMYLRIGKSSHNSNTNAFTLVPGTDRFYQVNTIAYEGFEAWQIANNASWSGSNSIYKVDGSGYAITKATTFQKYVVGSSGVTLVPTSSKNTENGCNYWNVDKYDGMLKHTATITAPTNGTISLAYTSKAGSPSTATVSDLPHRSYITATATPAAGYQLTTFTVTPEGGAATSLVATNGNTNNHILATNATFAATFSAKTITITWNGNGGTPSKASDTWVYNTSALASLPTATKDGKVFVGWFTDPSSGSQIDNVGGSNKPTDDVTYYAHWSDGNTVQFHAGVGSVTPTSLTQTTLDGAVAAFPTPTIDCEGWSFAGWKEGSAQTETTTNPEASLYAGGHTGYVPATATVHMYAVWKKNFGGGSGTITNTYDWEATNSSWSTYSISNVKTWTGGSYVTPHGSYSGNTSATGAYVRYMDQLTTPVSLEFYYTKATGNSNSNNKFWVETSTNGSTWTELAGTSVATNAMTRGTWEKKTVDLSDKSNIYVRIYWNSAAGDALALDDVTITYTGTIPDLWKWTSSADDYGCVSADQVKTPVISPDTEAQTGDVSVTITCATAGATIRYTTDGTNPSKTTGTVYSGAFTVSCSATVKAIAYKADMDDSVIASQAYTITVPTPTISLAGGQYFDANQSVTLSLPTAHTGTVIKYTTNGDDPTSSSSTYSSAITVTEGTTTIKAMGYNATCGTSSAIASETYYVRFGETFSLVTNVDDLNAGDRVVIVSADATTSTHHAISTTISANKRTATTDFNLAAGLATAKIYPALPGSPTVQEFTLGGSPGAWTFHETTNNGYLNCPSAGKLTNTVGVSNSNKWTITIASNIATIHNNDVDATIKSNTGSNHVFAAYGPASENVELVKLYSVPNSDPVIKVNADLSAFEACRGIAGDYQSFVVSGKNLTAAIVISGPAGYEFCRTSDGTYTSTLSLTPSTGTVANSTVYVRLGASATAGAHNGNLNAAVSANSLSTDIAVTGSVSTADTYTDQIHNTVVANQCGSYYAPSCADTANPGAATDCTTTHYKFMGWITETDRNASGVKDDAWYISHLVTAGTAMTADGTNYYAVWAKEED